MKPKIGTATRDELRSMIRNSPHIVMSERESSAMEACLMISDKIFYGMVDDDLACIWGLIPPTLMSDQAYLWLFTSSLVDEHKFVFVRHSQMWIEETLKEFPTIVGTCMTNNPRAKRWIEWLGGEFAQARDGRYAFAIRSHHG